MIELPIAQEVWYDGEDMMTVTERLRQAVETCGESRASISRATGVNEGILSRFVVNGDGLRSDT
ncbi:hypothetical protein IH781_02050, partial [Patescibacteria group bacterium]|nr:hypothetical protein [Patescibacteria group bacterium]